jgi:hypothetical protein
MNMTSPSTNRHHRVPNANSPQLLTRLLETVARGVRSSRGIQESLGVDVRTVQYYSQAADWLGLMDSAQSYRLTAIGLEYVYAGRDRAKVYSRAVWGTPFVADLMKEQTGVPSSDDIAHFIRQVDSELSLSTAKRRASSVRSLIGPALEFEPPLDDELHQLALPLPVAVEEPLPDLDLKDRHEFNPDVYRLVWSTLLDCGELQLQQLRALLDTRGADDLAIGGALELAVERGDAIRREDRLIATPASIARRDLLETTASIMLSDPGYRRYLQEAIAPLSEGGTGIRRELAANRYRYWDRRLFGHPLRPERLTEDLELVLLDRPLASFPLAGSESWEISPVEAPFLDSWDEEGMAICLPSYLQQLHGGVSRINAFLQAARHGGGQVELPSISTRPTVYHGGLLHPGEPLPRSVPDMRSLRLRAVMHSPYIAMVTGLLMLHRYRPELCALVKQGSRWEIHYGQQVVGELLEVLDAFCLDVGMVVCRHRKGSLDGVQLIDLVCGLGVCSCLGQLSILSERFFVLLREEAEEIEVHMLLQPLMGALDEWLASIEAPLFTETRS